MTSPREGSAAILGVGGHAYGNLDSGNTQMTGRVLYTLLTDDAKKLSQMNVPPGSIGAIQFRMLYNGQDVGDNFLVAYPIGHIKKYPVKNELVNIVVRASKESSNPSGNNVYNYYYDDILPVFDSPEHNALPTDVYFSGSNNSSITGDFKEKGNIYKLQHLPGDTIIEGRIGNSIRMGSSHPILPNTPWDGPQGNPVFVITNGQKPQTESNISATFEDINGDGSSMWGLNNHNITFLPASTLFDSYGANSTSTTVKNNIVVANNKVQTPVSSSLQTIDKVPVSETKPVVYPVSTPTVDTIPVIGEVDFLESEEQPEYNKEFEDIEVVERVSPIKFETAYTLISDSIQKNGNIYLNKQKALDTVKLGAYPDLPILDCKYTIYTRQDFANILNKLVSTGGIKKNVARSVLATAINEQSYNGKIRGINNDFFGVQSDLKVRWSLGPTYPHLKFAGQVFAKEGGTNKYRGYIAFSSLTEAIEFAIDQFYKKGFDSIPYDSSDSNIYAHRYIAKWYGASATDTLVHNKMYGYISAKDYIK